MTGKQLIFWLGIVLVVWGIFHFFNRTFYTFRYGNYVDLGPHYQEFAMIEIIIGLVIIYLMRK